MKLSNTVLLYKMEREKAMYWLSTKKAKIIMLLPTLMIYAVFIIIPVFIAIYYSFICVCQKTRSRYQTEG